MENEPGAMRYTMTHPRRRAPLNLTPLENNHQMAADHFNGCWRCPRLQGNSWIEEIFDLHGLRFSPWIAAKLVEHSMLCEVSHTSLARWVARARVDTIHVGHLPAWTEPGIAVTLPDEVALIDGNHRAARALRDGTPFVVYLLPADLTQELIRLTAERTGSKLC